MNFWNANWPVNGGEEHRLFGEYLGERMDKPDEGLRQTIWALLNSPEFRFIH